MPEPVTTDRRPGGPRMREPSQRPLLRTIFGRVFRRTRREQGRTLAEVARAARVSMPYLSELERGRKEASSEVVSAVCDALGIDLADLLAEAGRGLAASRAAGTAETQIGSATRARAASATEPRASTAGEARAGAGATAPIRHGAYDRHGAHDRRGTVVKLDDFRGRRAAGARISQPRSAPGPGEVTVLRAA